MNPKKIKGFKSGFVINNGNVWNCEYMEKEIENKTIITATLEIDRNYKTGVKIIEKAEENISSPLIKVLNEHYRDKKATINDNRQKSGLLTLSQEKKMKQAK